MSDAKPPSEIEQLEKELALGDESKAEEHAETPVAGAKKKSDATSAKGPEILWTVRIELILKAIWGQFSEIARGTFSSDRMTRRMSALFLLSCIGMVWVLVMGGRYYLSIQQAKRHAGGAEAGLQNMGGFFEKQADEAKRRHTTLLIGQFTLELKAIPDLKSVPGVLNMAELEIVAECDNKDTCLYVEEFMARARNEITGVFTAIDRDELMSREGKKRIKKRLIEKLNLWLPKGKIENLYFSKLIIS